MLIKNYTLYLLNKRIYWKKCFQKTPKGNENRLIVNIKEQKTNVSRRLATHVKLINSASQIKLIEVCKKFINERLFT